MISISTFQAAKYDIYSIRRQLEHRSTLLL
jgi:hypothetical protein